MDPKKLEQKLTEISEWMYPCVSQDNANERLISTTGKSYKQEFISKPDLGPRIIKFKETICLRSCDWCHKICNQKQSITKKEIPKTSKTPAAIKWHYSCDTCKRVWDQNLKQLKPLVKPKNQSG